MKVCIIGAGTAGLCAARHALASGFDVTLYEQTGEIGGTWVYTDDVGKNEYGIDIHTSMYQQLSTNLPKEVMGFPDFPIPEQDKSFIPSQDFLSFLNLYADNFQLNEVIKFLHQVIRVRPIEDVKWEIIARDLPNNEIITTIFDAVFICNGHYHTAFIPKLPGIESYKGKQTHSHDYRCPENFKDETVLLIGAGPSGIDMTHDVSKTAKRVTLSHHLKEDITTKFSKCVEQKPDVRCVTGNEVEFIDGTKETFSVIFYCTGYRYTFPFLSADCGISVAANYVQPLYKHCMNINNPTMAFIGLPFYVCASQMFDLQVRFCIKFLSGQKQFPSKDEMKKDTEKEMNERWLKGYSKRQAHLMGSAQGTYYIDLANTADLEPMKPVMTKMHVESARLQLADSINFRKYCFKIIDDETYEVVLK